MTARLHFKSPLGWLSAEATDEGLCGLVIGERGPPRPPVTAAARGHLEAAEQALRDYFAGRAPAALPALDLKGSPFQREVWAALLAIPWGEVRTYGELAQALGKAGGARAVGGANAENPVAILVPCHRVVQASGRIGGYAGGVEVKRWLLAHEAAYAPALRRP
ncbi:MAG: methylated-DNA--[protein]-cysteine S-methyltransferase [Anaeromyxobacter sp.]